MAIGKIVAFHTPDALYTHEAKRMVASVAQFGLPIEVTTVESAGSWVWNCSRKSSFLLDRRRELRGILLYLDVDAILHSDPWPTILPFDEDLGAYYPDRPGGWLNAATVVLGDTPACLQAVGEWRDGCVANPDAWDQQVLQRVIDTGRFRFRRLPQSLCSKFGAGTAKPIIEQLHASREARLKRDWRFWRRKPVHPNVIQRRVRVAAIDEQYGLAEPSKQASSDS